ncbi:MAG: hypothetical protein BWK80_44230 [Desulfobacteraceae bacterium IS3]|nr:MAG: hypothetical protein BWK80_44230 [Desulfobacteraceae bacterium IS3]
MKYLWDTDTCIYYLNGNGNIRRKVKAVGSREICTTVITVAELKFGAYHSAKVGANLERIAKLQKKLTILYKISDPITTAFAENKSLLKKKGITIGDFDLLIAGFALHYKLVIVTNNISHFKQISSLEIENWSI